MNILRRITALSLCIVMVLTMAACGDNTGSSVSQESSSETDISQESSEEASENSDNSTEEEASNEDVSTEEVSDEEDLTEADLEELFENDLDHYMDEDIFGASTILLDPDTGNEEFVAAFKANEIDAEYLAAYEASENIISMMQSCDAAAEKWRDQIDYGYIAALEATEGEERRSIREGQEAWLSGIDESVENIRSGYDQTASISKYLISADIMLFYRQRAMVLSQIVFEKTGEMPQVTDGVG